MTIQDEFTDIYQQYIHREGADRFLEYLQGKSSDFFVAPASTRYHGSYAGGLAQHSINVYHCLRAYLERERVKDVYGMSYSDETIALVSLLHDKGSVGKVFEKFPLAFALSVADMEATYFLEGKQGPEKG